MEHSVHSVPHFCASYIPNGLRGSSYPFESYGLLHWLQQIHGLTRFLYPTVMYSYGLLAGDYECSILGDTCSHAVKLPDLVGLRWGEG